MKYLLTFLAFCGVLTMGATPNDPPKYVARTATLTPQPIQSVPVEPVVKQEVIKEEPLPSPIETPQTTPESPVQGGGGGYALPYGNCVNEPGVKRQSGNPISWQPTTQTPYIGATFLFYTNHTGVVVEIHGDMIEVRHQNYQGGQYIFPRSMFRGFI